MGSKLMPLRALAGRSGTLYDILQAVRYAAGIANDSGQLPSRPADIVDLSLGSRAECTAEEADVYSAVIAQAMRGRGGGRQLQLQCRLCAGLLPGRHRRHRHRSWQPARRLFELRSPVRPGCARRRYAFDADADGFFDGVFAPMPRGWDGSRRATPRMRAHRWRRRTSQAFLR